MRFLLVALLLSSTALADRRQGPTFKVTTSYEHCQTTYAFACNIPDGRGGRYGTAHQMRHCTRYTFRPDGTFSERGSFALEDEGTYRIFAGMVRVTLDDGLMFELALSLDGTKLGEMSRVNSP